MTSISDIREEIFKNSKTQRIVIKVHMHTDSLDSQEIRDSAYRVVDEVFPDWEHDSRILFLAIEIWSDRTYMAIDINHHDYKFDTAHKSTAIFPVFVLGKHRKRGWKIVRWPQGDELIAEKLAYLHNANGFDVATPFFENHNSRIIHANPRELPI